MTTQETIRSAAERRLSLRSDLSAADTQDIAAGLNRLLADTFTLYLKTKNFHWHLSGPHFRDYHLMLDDQAAALIAMTDPLAERVRKLGRTTLRSVGDISRRKSLLENEADYVEPFDMLAELQEDTRHFLAELRGVHGICSAAGDVASTSLIEVWIDEAETRIWFLYEAGRSTPLL
ncbi:DNA starvation/stationary phase protection protein [Pseudooceanicola sp. CBS1P-1]|uniref:DNA starvation/stationary phase protection protein n=1 Tax=Pseudooceanicola albus TaxID=2692189 RepID=A0A6L7G5A1_9RHOB|nr:MULTISPECIES: DNA starvation/stationary phase protection protein [Pseudooceanicola]MBT9386035.1 DNA starvation/stationary phase protection protein [Pseudooceanicola endophyticus]MXN19544.1 DNA starvation/stationary phase protection protein [Pseudooceanicola albus]